MCETETKKHKAAAGFTVCGLYLYTAVQVFAVAVEASESLTIFKTGERLFAEARGGQLTAAQARLFKALKNQVWLHPTKLLLLRSQPRYIASTVSYSVV